MSSPSPDRAHDLLEQLGEDRTRLAALTATPWWAPVLLGLVAGLWVASPAVGDRTAGYLLALLGAVLVVSLVRTRTGIRVRAAGPRSAGLAVLWLLVTLVLYSVALGLVSLDRAAWVAAPAVVAGVVTCAVVRVADRWSREALRS